MSGVTLEIDTTGFRAMCEDLARISGKDYDTALVSQLGQVLRNCVAHSPIADRGVIIKRVSDHANYVKFSDGTVISLWKKAGNKQMFLDTSNFDPKRSKKPPRLIEGKSWHDMTSRHWSDARWARYKAYDEAAQQIIHSNKRLKADLKAALGARGLTAQEWLKIGADVGVSPEAILGGSPKYIQNAKPSDGSTHKNGFAKKIIEGDALYIDIATDNPILMHLKHPSGAQILEMAVAARLKAFEGDMSHGVFDDMKRRAQRYPGVFVQ